MSKYEHGRVLSVDEVKSGSELVADHAGGVSSLTVVDAADFDEDGGWLSINDQVIEYTASDDDTGTLTLNGTLTALADEGDRVYLWNPKRAAISSELIAEVTVDGEGDNVDPIEATVALHLVPDLPEGIRGSDGESVLLELDGDEWRVVDVLGVASQAVGTSDKEFFQDYFTLGQDGAQAIELTYEPVVHSEHLYWNGLYQRQFVNWARDGRVISLLDTPVPPRTGDRVSVEYAYYPAVIQTPAVPDEVIPDEPPPDPADPANFFIPVTGDVAITATGYGPEMADTRRVPDVVGPHWAPGDSGYVQIGGFYHADGTTFGGTANASVQYTPSLPAWQDTWKIYVLVRAQDYAFTKFYTRRIGDPYEESGEGFNPPRLSMYRTGGGGSAKVSDDAHTFEWQGWTACHLDTGNIADMYAGLKVSSFRSRVKVYARASYPPPRPLPDAAATRRWTITEVAVLVVTGG